MMRIIVCIKLISDPEMPFSQFKIDSEAKKPRPPIGIPPVMSPFDENALEAALRIKDKRDCEITVMSLGESLPKAILQRALAVGADNVIGIEDQDLEHLDPYSTVQALASGIQKLGDYDLIFTGRQAADWNAGLVWAGIAEQLDIPSITIARKAEVNNGKVIVERCVSDGIEILESDMPALVTFSSETGELRYPTLPALLKVKKREIPKWSASDIGFKNSNVMQMRDFYIPNLGQVDCYLVPGESLGEKGRNLARKLMEEGIILRGV